ncbi:MAG: hypothetical protein ACYDEN_11490 [Acidimicrobiales bacterium]
MTLQNPWLRHRAGRAATIPVIALTCWLAGAAGLPGAALAGCNPNRTDDGVTYFDGWLTGTEPTTVTANSSNIYNYPAPYVYPGNGVFAWVMIVGGSGNYAQVGWVTDYNSSGNRVRQTFTEWHYGSHIGSDFSITAQPTNTTSWYEVATPNGTGTNYCFYVNGSAVGSCSGSLGWYGTGGQDLAEIHTLADQMPGGTHNPEEWSNAFIFDNGNRQYNFNGHATGNTTYFNYAIYSQTMAEASDKACSS